MTDISLRYLLFGEDRSASKTAHGVAHEAEGSASKVGAAFGRMGHVIGGEVGEVLDKVGEGLEQIGEHSKKMSAGLIVGGSALTGVGAALQMIGSKDKQAQDQLRQAITNTGQSYADYREEIEKTIKKQENYGHSAVDSQRAMQVLTQATNDPKRAIEDMGIVANVAAAKHQSLSDTALQLAKVYGGSGRILKEFGITMDSTKQAAAALNSAERQHSSAQDQYAKATQRLADVHSLLAGKTKLTAAEQIRLRNATDDVKTSHERLEKMTNVLSAAEDRNKEATHASQTAIEELGQKTDGQAKAAVDNFSGRIDVLKTKLEDWAAGVGNKVGPAMTAIGPVLMTAGGIMQIVTTRNAAAAVAQDAEAAATLRQKVAQEAAAVASKGWAAAQWLLNAALDANPIGIVVVALAALVGGFILAWQHSETFRNTVKAALNAVGDAATALWTDAIRPAFKFITDLWFTVVGALVDGAASAFGWMPGLGGKLKAAAKHFDAFRNDVNDALSGISDKTVHVNADLRISHAANAALHAAAPLTIGSARAAGGPVGPGSMYLVGERGPEVVTFGASGFVTPNSSSRQLLAGGDAGGITINVNGALDPDATARKIDQMLRRLNSSTGGALAGYAS